MFVLDQKKRPLMPTTPKRARLLLARGRAVVHRVKPFVIRLRDRRVEASVLQPVALKLDPGSRVSGMALARVEPTPEGEVQHALFLAEVRHRGEAVHEAKRQQAAARRRGRSANLRHRAPRFLNRRRPAGWLPPSLRSRMDNVVSWTARFCRWAPVSRIEVERVRFDTQLIQHPEITGTEYQQGELAGWELRAYLLVKYAYRCAYCGQQHTPFELDHQVPRSRGGSDQASNLVLACHDCNQAKGDRTAAEFGHPEVAARAKAPLKDAAAVNATRYRLVEELRCVGVPVGTWSGGRTRWNRARFGLEKTHALDALAVGELAGVQPGTLTTLSITAIGRGQHCRTLWNRYGFPRAYLPRRKRVAGFITGDRVKAVVPAPLKTAGVHVGRIAVRTSGSCAIRTSSGTVDGIHVKYLRLVQRGDGYAYLGAPEPGKDRAAPPPASPTGTPASSVLLSRTALKEGVSAGGVDDHTRSDVPQAVLALGPVSLRDGGVNLGWMTRWSVEHRTPSYAYTTQEAIEMGTARTMLVIEYVGGTKDEFEGEAAELLLSYLQDRAEPTRLSHSP